MKGGRGDLSGLIKVKTKDLSETSGVGVHVRAAVTKSLEHRKQGVEFFNREYFVDSSGSEYQIMKRVFEIGSFTATTATQKH